MRRRFSAEPQGPLRKIATTGTGNQWAVTMRRSTFSINIIRII